MASALPVDLCASSRSQIPGHGNFLASEAFADLSDTQARR
jgi:hypothetical protein